MLIIHIYSFASYNNEPQTLARSCGMHAGNVSRGLTNEWVDTPSVHLVCLLRIFGAPTCSYSAFYSIDRKVFCKLVSSFICRTHGAGLPQERQNHGITHFEALPPVHICFWTLLILARDHSVFHFLIAARVFLHHFHISFHRIATIRFPPKDRCCKN